MIDYTSVLDEQDGKVILPNGLKLNMSRENYIYMQLLQEYVIEVLLVVDKFCRDNGLTYYLGEGTLLGAVRHGGFIPWDDDVDILMPRADYERFLQIAKDGLPEGYALESMETNPNHWTIMSQVQMTRTVPHSKERLNGIALHNGPSVDIFPLDFVPSSKDKNVQKRGKAIQTLRRTMWIKSGLHPRSWYKTLRRRLKYYYPLKFYGFFRSLPSLYNQAQKLMTATNDDSLDCLCIFSSLYNVNREVFKKEYFGTPKYMEFEGHLLPVPSNPEKILKQIYGDYMLLPPVKSRKSKHFFEFNEEVVKEFEDDEAFRKTIEYLQKQPASEAEEVDVIEKKKRSAVVKYIAKIKRKIIQIRRSELISRYYSKPILEKTVVYDSFSGLGILDSPRTIFKRLLEREEFSDYTHVWAIKDSEMVKSNLDEFRDLKNVIFVKRNSEEYIKYLTTAKYLISNSSVPQYYSRRPEQVYLNTWHGVPTKVMGYERPGQRVNATKNVVHNFINATHLITANHFTGERMYKQAYMLDGIYEGRMLDMPLPRTDAIRNTDREYVFSKLKEAGIVTDKKIIVYAPTWKGKLYNSLEYDLTELKGAVKTLKENINTGEYEVLLRVHYFLYRAISVDEEMKKMCIPFTIDTNELLSVVDILISDYSSIFFDFLSTRRPILFYVPDIENYSENRGLYIPMEEMPGPVSTTLEGIADKINRIEQVKADYADKYNTMYQWCCSKEDGKAADRVIDAVFLNQESEIMNCKGDKKKLLIMAQFTKQFIYSTKLAELLKQVDYSEYDVTLLTSVPKDESRRQLLENLDLRVRILITNYKINCRWLTKKSVFKALNNGTLDLEEAVKTLGYRREWQRAVGDCTFDQLCLIKPESITWLLLSYIAPIKNKSFIKLDNTDKSVFENSNMLKHFDSIYDDMDHYFEAL